MLEYCPEKFDLAYAALIACDAKDRQWQLSSAMQGGAFSVVKDPKKHGASISRQIKSLDSLPKVNG